VLLWKERESPARKALLASIFYFSLKKIRNKRRGAETTLFYAGVSAIAFQRAGLNLQKVPIFPYPSSRFRILLG
jgi:hypothetical protein